MKLQLKKIPTRILFRSILYSYVKIKNTSKHNSTRIESFEKICIASFTTLKSARDMRDCIFMNVTDAESIVVPSSIGFVQEDIRVLCFTLILNRVTNNARYLLNFTDVVSFRLLANHKNSYAMM